MPTFLAKKIIITSVLVIYSLTASFADSNQIVGIPRIIDGDTIEIRDQKIRLHGIDAPEKRQLCKKDDGLDYRCGQESTLFLIKIIGNNAITCQTKSKDRYKRWIAICLQGGIDINSEMVKAGWALAYRKYSQDYVEEERQAKKSGLGLWQGEFLLPWAWRRR